MTVKEKEKGHGLGSPHTHLLLAAMEAEHPAELEEGLKKQMKDVAKALEDKGKRYVGERIFHFRVKEMYNKADSGQVGYKLELGMNLFGDYSMTC